MINFKINNSLKTFGIFTIMLALIFNSVQVIDAAKGALVLCFSTIIPSLFPFMVLSSLFVGSITDKSFRYISKALKKVFGISNYSAAAFICGIVCGYPIGAKCTAELYLSGRISRSEAESLLAYANNSGPLFIIGAAGCSILHSMKAGILLYTIHVICALSAALLLKPYTYSKSVISQSKHQKKTFTEAICESSVNVINVCGFIIFFAVINTLIMPCMNVLPVWLRCIFTGIIEITNSITYTASHIHVLDTKLALIAAALGWSGLSVHMQVKSVIKETNLSMKKYYLTRAYIAVASAVLVYTVSGHTDDIVCMLPLKSMRVWGLVICAATVMCICAYMCVNKKRGKLSPSSHKN